MSKKQPDKLHGNNAKVDPSKHVESLYSTNTVTMASKTKNPQERDAEVEYARNFANENKK